MGSSGNQADTYGFTARSEREPRVKLYLPRYYQSESIADVRAAADSIPQAHGETILVVEDDSDVRSFTSNMLRELGYLVIEASDGPSAIRLLEAHREIQLLLTDVGLPGGMNGRQLADEAQRRRLV